MTAQFSLRRVLAIAVAALVGVLALHPGSGNASQLPFYDGHGTQVAYAQVGFFCQGRYVHYRADTFVSSAMYFGPTPVAYFQTRIERWNGRDFIPGELVITWLRTSIAGQYALVFPSGNGYFRLSTQYAFWTGSRWEYSDWKLETFNGNGLPFCKV